MAAGDNARIGDKAYPSFRLDARRTGRRQLQARLVAHVADAVRYLAALPLSANVQFMTVMATTMPFIGRG